MSDGIKSHIQMPKLIMKNFVNEYNTFYYYDVSKNKICTKGHPKSMNTEKGYYSCDMENFLESEVETPFSRFINYLIECLENNKDIHISLDDIQTIKNYAYSLIVRSPKMIEMIRSESVLYGLVFDKQNQHNIAVAEGLNIAKTNGLLDDYLVTLTLNISNTPFVLPMCGMYSNAINKVKMIHIPVTPKVIITLYDKQQTNEFIHNGLTTGILITTDSVANGMNKFAFEAQLLSEQGFIASPQKEALSNVLNRGEILNERNEG